MSSLSVKLYIDLYKSRKKLIINWFIFKCYQAVLCDYFRNWALLMLLLQTIHQKPIGFFHGPPILLPDFPQQYLIKFSDQPDMPFVDSSPWFYPSYAVTLSFLQQYLEKASLSSGLFRLTFFHQIKNIVFHITSKALYYSNGWVYLDW